MIICKILNNNAVISKNETGKEIVVMGKGIAFQKRNGEEIEIEHIAKIFTLSNTEKLQDLENILTSIPDDYLNVSLEIIQYAKQQYKFKLNDIIYVSLADHLYTTIQRIKNNITIHNPMLWEIKKFYKDEYEASIKAVSIIEKQFDIELPTDEAGFIALHFVEAQMSSDQPIVKKVTELIQEISDIVKNYFGIEYNENSIYYYRFITHLKFFAERVFEYIPTSESDNDLLETIKTKYFKAYDCVVRINDFLNNKYDYKLSDDETLYLTIHIQKVIEELLSKKQSYQYKEGK